MVQLPLTYLYRTALLEFARIIALFGQNWQLHYREPRIVEGSPPNDVRAMVMEGNVPYLIDLTASRTLNSVS